MLDFSGPERAALSAAHRQMSTALDLLDEADAPGEIACHLDLALARLERMLATGMPDVRTIAPELESIFSSDVADRACESPWP